MKTDTTLERGRQSFARGAWSDAYAQLSAASADGALDAEDLERLATAAYLIGNDTGSREAWARAHQEFLTNDDAPRAARAAFWLAFGLLDKGETARAGGWLARAQRLLDDGQHDCAERGYLLIPAALHAIAHGDHAEAYASFAEAAAIGDRFRDRDLMTLGRLGRGQALIGLGETVEGMSLLDEAMVAVTASEVSPVVAGLVYCAVIEACQEVFDLRRAREWTAALTEWCAAQPDLVLYRGQCLVHRAEIMRLHGAWRDALDEAQRARERLSNPAEQPAVGAAFYQLAEIHRLRGEFAKAEEAYRQASRWGHSAQPGSAQLRLAQGQIDAAAAAIRRVLDETQDRVARSKVLPASVEIMLAGGDVRAARSSADELATIAADGSPPLLRALAATAIGAVLLAEGDPRAALAELRPAWIAWHDLEAPYEAARVRMFVALACRALGDEDGARMELDAARAVFHQLGALPDVSRVDELSGRAAPRAVGGLSAREVEVLRLVATGKTNRAIADQLVISEKTVARHVANIFAKVGVSTRAAATAYAYEHELLA